MACSCNHLCHGNTACSLCIDIHAAVNNIEVLNVDMEMQQWVPFDLFLLKLKQGFVLGLKLNDNTKNIHSLSLYSSVKANSLCAQVTSRRCIFSTV